MNRLEKLRTDKGMSRQELADAVKVTRVSIYRYECGDRVPDLSIANRLAKAIGCSLEDLVDDETASVNAS